MRGWLVRTLLAAVLVTTSIQGIRPMVSYRALELGASPVDLGVVAASYALLSFIVAAPLGRWVDRQGEARFVVAGASLTAVVGLALSLIGTLPGVIVAQAVLGLGQVTALVAIQTLIANGGDRAGRDGRFGAFTVTTAAGMTIGPTVAGLLYGSMDLTSAQVFLLAVLPAIAAVALGVTLWVRPAPRARRGAPPDASPDESLTRTVTRVMRQPSVPHAMLASLTVLTSIDLLIAYLPAYGEANGVAASTIGLILGIRAAAGVASRALMLPLLRRSNRRRLLAQSMLLPAVTLAVMPLTTDPLLLGTLLAAAGFGLGLGQPLSMSWIADQVPRAIRGTALGVRITGNRVAQLLVPLGAGVVAGASGVGAIFLVSGAMLGVSSWLTSRAPTGGAVAAPGEPAG